MLIPVQSPILLKVLLTGGMPDLFWYDSGNLPADEMPVGSIVRAPLRGRLQIGLVIETGSPQLDFRTKPVHDVAQNARPMPTNWIRLLEWLGDYYSTPLPAVGLACLPKNALAQLFAAPKKARVVKPKAAPAQDGSLAHLNPTPEQQQAIASVGSALAAGRFEPFLVHGITGSGKTLVYLHLAKQALQQGRNVLVLLPEIALTAQTLSRFQSFLPEKVHAMHHNLGARDKRELWQALFAGTARVIVGARSAVLAPIDNLGLIVVDEEHESSYKQSDAAPRYNARDVALYRGKLEGCPVVLGSATPSLESYHAASSGKYGLLKLKQRASGRLPKVRIVDMREQLELQGSLPLSIPLREALQDRLQRGEQAILLQNRRGYAPKRQCSKCGQHRQCPNCLLPLVYHKRAQRLKCHYCDYAMNVNEGCRECGSHEFVDFGLAIERVEEYVQGIFSGVGISRLDRDTTGGIGGADKVLEEFKSGATQILLGTQMVAKGHDFPNVNLVGVVDADTGMGLSDFRAQERLFQLITQVAGRAGRHGDSGEVFLQTFRPQDPVLHHALAQDYESFVAEELKVRAELEFPPFRKLLLVEISGPDEEWVERHMVQFGAAFKRHAQQVEARVLGPAFAALKRINRQYRAQIVAKGHAANQLQWLLRQTLQEYRPERPQETKLRADMDPLTML